MKIKLVCYNILNGITTDGKPYILDKKRRDAVIEIINEEKPDVLALCEAWFWPFAKKDSLKNIERLVDSLTKTQFPSEEVFRYAPVIFSRFPITYQNLSEYHRKLVRSKIRVGTKEITLDLYHPSPDKITEEEKASFLGKHIDKIMPRHILAGDFNTASPHDNYDAAKLLRGYSTFMGNAAGERVRGLMAAETVRLVLSKGFVDSYKIKEQKEKYTVPTDFRSKNKDSSVRIDYIFCSKDIKVIDSGIIKNKFTEIASDHYPIYAVLEI
ncbi:MAG TPA: endonuclease/exonuclease/phosphatase family protein [Candidatus Nanoarchaeia archaeon]|nr:endonuclease/exonuclease/phosphatase family protein [Candidatus Nanoarchaeia archaeon]